MHTTKKQRDSNKTVLQRLVGAFFFFNEVGTFQTGETGAFRSFLVYYYWYDSGI